jgi:hypothetical protein
VYAWVANRTEAIAYNTRTKMTGRIPADRMETYLRQEYSENKLYKAEKDESPTSVNSVALKAGDYIWV